MLKNMEDDIMIVVYVNYNQLGVLMMETESREDIKNIVIKEASRLFMEQGYTKTTIRQIAEACNLGRGHLYYYFRKKEDIVLDLYKKLIEGIYSYIKNAQVKSPNQLLNYAITQYIYIKVIATNKDLFRMYIEASKVDVLRKAYLEIVKEILQERLTDMSYKGEQFTQKDVNLSIVIGSAGEDELLRRYYNNDVDLSLEEIIEFTIKTRLLLLNISHQNVNKIIDRCGEEISTIKINQLINHINLLDI